MKYRILSISFTILLVLFCYDSWGQPVISSVSGTVSHNSSITISGMGFGTKTPVAPNLWDTVENQYSGLSDGDTIPVGKSFPWQGNYQNLTKYATSDTQRHPRSIACYKAYGYNTHIGGRATGGSKIYISWWWKPVVDASWTNYSIKMIRAGKDGEDLAKTFSWTGMHHYVWTSSEGYCMGYPNNCGVALWDQWPGNRNQWNINEVYLDGNARTYSLWVNGITVRSNANWACCTAFEFNYVGLIGYNGNDPAQPWATSYIDDIYIDTTLARVVVGNASTFAKSTHRELQIPSAWSPNSITITVNQGAFQNGQTAYLYVVDENGNVNSTGYPITIGRDASAPSSPKGLRIVN